MCVAQAQAAAIVICRYLCKVLRRSMSGDVYRRRWLKAPNVLASFKIVISVYAFALCSSQELITAFYRDVRNCIISIPNADKILLL